ncbi:hypothetical protein CLA01_04440 [Chryseobacterium lathyri]|uniref:Uncharacterized protein n=1 Tax=Chryseobacterium lathyri TaxID=395933 RepID=A0A511Y598_9FLAO|nr:hypothetical protein CLA01_04440 [Chryseobacterium lathyri]
MSEKLPELKNALPAVNAKIFKVVIILFLLVICYNIEPIFSDRTLTVDVSVCFSNKCRCRFIVLIPEVKLSVFKAENWETW